MPEPIFFTTPDQLRAWFDAHHETESELWLGYYKKHTGRSALAWSDAVDEALCVGWIDGLLRRIDDETHMQRFTPRKQGSHWSNINVAKVAVLVEQGRMRPAGLAAFAARSDARTGQASFERAQPAQFTPEQEQALRANPAAWDWFSSAAPSYRRTATHWVVSAKREETRARRLVQLIECSAEGRKLPQFISPTGK
jgi:uncharacterized protein YdeI (YjbR/CyaY-like superfamily)